MQEITPGGTFSSVEDRYRHDARPLAEESSPPPAVPTISAAPTSEAQKVRIASRAKTFMLDTIFAIAVFIFGGTLALYGMRKATILRVFVEVCVVFAFVAAGYFALDWLAPGIMDGWSLGEPAHRAVALTVLAFSLSYVGGTVAFWGWRYSRDARVGMLLLALGVALMGGRVTSLGMAFGELRVQQGRIFVAGESLKMLKSTMSIMKEAGVDPKPLGEVIVSFRDSVYGAPFASALGDAWKYRGDVPHRSMDLALHDEAPARRAPDPTMSAAPAGSGLSLPPESANRQ